MLVVFFRPPTGADTALALGQLALCGGGLYIHTLHMPVGMMVQPTPCICAYTHVPS